MNHNFKVSLIMSTYNRPDALELTLLSALKQSYKDFEIIVADDGSKNDTKNLVESFQRNSSKSIRHVWHSDEGFQLAKIRNKAIAVSNGDYVISIDADQVLHTNFVEDHVSVARQGVFLQGHRVLLTKEKTDIVLKSKEIEFSCLNPGLSNRKNAIHSKALRDLLSFSHTRLKGVRGSNMSFWKKDLLATNGFNEAFVGWGREDSELVLRLFHTGVKRADLYFSAIAYHLYHPENSRDQLSQNDIELERTLSEKRKYCEKGISQYVT